MKKVIMIISYQFRMTKQDHSRFVQAVRYSPAGNLFASAGFDGKVYLYDGTTSELVGEVGSPAHQGGVYGVNYPFFLKFIRIFVDFMLMR